MPTVEELKQFCKDHGIRGYSSLRKAELLQLVQEYEIKNNINTSKNVNQNYLSRYPNVIQSKIGNYLNLRDINSIYIITGNISVFQDLECINLKLSEYTYLQEYKQSLEKLNTKINFLLTHSKNLKQIELEYIYHELRNGKGIDFELALIDLNQLTIKIKQFRKLEALSYNLETLTYLLDIYYIPAIRELLRIFRNTINTLYLKYLNLPLIELNITHWKVILENPNLEYFNFSTDLSSLIDEEKFISPIQTLYLYDTENDLKFEHFPKLRRLICGDPDNINQDIDSEFMNKLGIIPNLQALEISRSVSFDINVLKNLKFLRFRNLFDILSNDISNPLTNFFERLILSLSNLEYLSIGSSDFEDDILILLPIVLKTGIKVLYIDDAITPKHGVLSSKVKQFLDVSLKESTLQLKVTLVDIILYQNSVDFLREEQYLQDLGLYLKPECYFIRGYKNYIV